MYRLYRRHFVVQLLNLLALLFLLGHHVLRILQLKFKNHVQTADVHILQKGLPPYRKAKKNTS